MQNTNLTDEQFVELGESIYQRQIKSVVEPSCHGKFLAIDTDTGEYEMDSRLLTALNRARAKRPNGLFFIKRVGFPAAVRIGGAQGRS